MHAPMRRSSDVPESGVGSDLALLVASLCRSDDVLGSHASACPSRQPFPSRDTVIEIVEGLRAVLFPGYFGQSELTSDNTAFHMGSTLDAIRRMLLEQVRRGLCFDCGCPGGLPRADCEARAGQITSAFLNRLPEVRRLLSTDVLAAYEGDPAATSPDEAVFCYPGVRAVTDYRLAHELHKLEVPLIPRMITEHAHSVTGIDIHPGAQIDERFFIDHGTGVVIGETCVIGKRVRLYQGVTLGAKSFPLDANGHPVKGAKRHPDVEDDVIIYSEATILGPITIGQGSVIGGNVWLVRSVPPNSRVTQAQVKQEAFEGGAGI